MHVHVRLHAHQHTHILLPHQNLCAYIPLYRYMLCYTKACPLVLHNVTCPCHISTHAICFQILHKYCTYLNTYKFICTLPYKPNHAFTYVSYMQLKDIYNCHIHFYFFFIIFFCLIIALFYIYMYIHIYIPAINSCHVKQQYVCYEYVMLHVQCVLPTCACFKYLCSSYIYIYIYI